MVRVHSFQPTKSLNRVFFYCILSPPCVAHATRKATLCIRVSLLPSKFTCERQLSEKVIRWGSVVRSVRYTHFHASVRKWSSFRWLAQILPFSQKIAFASSPTGSTRLFSTHSNQRKES